jgi:hypothetical protein
MALHLNLFHEEILEQRQRKQDPLKIGMMVLGAFGALMFLYYMWNAYQTLAIKSRLSALQQDWAKAEPTVIAAEKKSGELNGIINTTRVLDGMIGGRFYWASFLDRVARCVAPNSQLTSIDGSIEESKGVSVSIEGVAAGREPRSAAEDLRQLLLEQLAKSYTDVKVEFKALEDLDTIVSVGGANMPMARYVLTVNLNSPGAAKPIQSAPPTRKPKHEEN